ncbi:fam-d protein [Plasmodium chabaudi chabaudi]|uniref:Fam-d protein n=1 Tax=Plasmodium chabaudi chabaudi TaxID=31271 RepID=A0A4V6M9B7_PLACU|nr:fam-d protein [Plasmodium chabaudi chabaudi]VTZ68872.1 fam-d protein [Plasmodium chabaudi chabaudi]|eukprot:XP_743563.1 fam-d protein [Plasmodium chabaudi chabaudi]
MLNIILSFFILVIFSNVKSATLQDANNNSPKPIGYVSVTHPTAKFTHRETIYTEYLDIINNIFRDESKNLKYEYQGGNCHWVITDFDVSLNNSSQSLKAKFYKKGKAGLIKGSAYFIAYIKDNIKSLISQHLHKYDFHSNYHEVKTLAKDLKGLIYDEFDQNLKQDLIKYETGLTNEKYHKKAKNVLKALVNNSSMNIKGYFVKIREDGNYMNLNQDMNIYFDVNISKNDVRAIYKFEFLKKGVDRVVANLISST